MRRALYVLIIIFSSLIALSANSHADLNNNWVIDRTMADRVQSFKGNNGFSLKDFNACQITWNVKPLKRPTTPAIAKPHEVTFQYENKEVIKLFNTQDGSVESIKGLGLNCLEFNNHIYLFFDTLDYDTRVKFSLSDLSYVIYSTDKGSTWSNLLSLHQFSKKAKFILPHEKFSQYVKIFGNKRNHALSIFNLRDETTYLFNSDLKVLKSVPVYNRLSDFDYPTDFQYHKNIIYLVRGSCEKVRGNIQCPARSYLETSRDFGQSWKKEVLPFIKKSYLFNIESNLYHFYIEPCDNNWFGLLPALDQSYVCGNIKARKLDILGKWGKPKTLIKSADKLLGIYYDTQPVLVWRDFRYHKRRPCSFIPLVGCVDSSHYSGPNVTYAGELDVKNWHIKESLIEYKN